jgi:hypothetical protein
MAGGDGLLEVEVETFHRRSPETFHRNVSTEAVAVNTRGGGVVEAESFI